MEKKIQPKEMLDGDSWRDSIEKRVFLIENAITLTNFILQHVERGSIVIME